jgi:hypothetical protein
MDGSDEPLDPAEGLAIVEAQRLRVKQDAVDPRVLFGAWGAAWLLGYSAMAVSSARSVDHAPNGWAGATFGVALLSAGVVTAVHITRHSRGMRGPTATAGAMYGWAWSGGFVAMAALLVALARLDVSGRVQGLVSNAVACLVVGVLYIAGGALWQARPMVVLGGWILLVSAVAGFVPMPASYVLMAVAGGGGMLVAAAGAALTHRRR